MPRPSTPRSPREAPLTPLPAPLVSLSPSDPLPPSPSFLFTTSDSFRIRRRRRLTAGHAQTGDRFAVAPDDAHKRLDRKDERSHANALADAAATEKKEQEADAARLELAHDPTVIAKSHGNEPSQGAKKDKQIFDDEEEELRKKEEAKQQSKEAHKH